MGVGDGPPMISAIERTVGRPYCGIAPDGARVLDEHSASYRVLADHARGDLDSYFHRNQRIHLMIVDMAGNAVLSQLYRNLNDQVRRVRYMANLSQQRWDTAIQEHEDILAALTARNVEKLKALLADHLAHKLTVVSQALASKAAEG